MIKKFSSDSCRLCQTLMVLVLILGLTWFVGCAPKDAPP